MAKPQKPWVLMYKAPEDPDTEWEVLDNFETKKLAEERQKEEEVIDSREGNDFEYSIAEMTKEELKIVGLS